MRKSVLAAVTLLTALTGCATPDSTVIHKREFVLMEIDPRYLRDCHIVPPPNEEVYLQSNLDAREDMLTRTILDQHLATRECNNDKRAIRSLLEKQRAQVEEFNSKKEVKP